MICNNQYFILGVIAFSIVYHKQINKGLNSWFDRVNIQGRTRSFLKLVIYGSPLAMMAYCDINFSSFSFSQLGIPPEYNNAINYVLKILGAYGIIQVLAQDLGIKTGTAQRDLVQLPFVQWLMLFAAGYVMSEDRSASLIAATMYYVLKYDLSDGETSAVCFEEV